MSAVVADMLRSRDRRPGQLDDESKGQFFWRILRESVKETSKLVAKADARDVEIAHGVHHLRKINHPDPITTILHNVQKSEYLTVTERGFTLFHLDGRYKDRIEPEEPVDRLIYAHSVRRYVGWLHDTDSLKVFQDDFELISEAQSPYIVSCAAYHDQQGQIVSAGKGHVMSWTFRYGARHLIPGKLTREGLPATDVYSLIALEDTASRTQRCFLSCGSSVAVINLYEGRVLSYKKNLHVRSISCILFFNPLKYLITGARDGSIKAWDDEWDLQLVFVGHQGPVRALAVYPYGPSIMSGSEDCTIRVWSLETNDEVDLIHTTEPVEGLGTVLNSDSIHSYSSNTVHLWRLRQIHNLSTAVGSKVDKIKTTVHPEFPTRLICISRSGSVRIISPGTGDVITSYVPSSGVKVVDAAYASAQSLLFVVLSTGDILKTDATSNPCQILHSVNTGQSSSKDVLTCICLYEYVVESIVEKDAWKGIMKSINILKSPNMPHKFQSKNRTLLIAGRRNGNVAVMNWSSLEVTYQTEAHGAEGVLGAVANPKHDQLITSGRDFGIMDDNVLKIWRVFPFAEESLAPLMSIYCAHTPLHMSVMKNTLAVAFQDSATVTYSIVHYNLVTKSRNDHSPDDDHIDSITGLACNPRMRYFVSSSLDGTVKLWDEYNRLVRSIKLNAEPSSLNFSSERGDLLVGIGRHVHKIDHTTYLPRPFLRKMVSMVFRPPACEEPIPYNEQLTSALSPLGNKRLRAAHSSIFRFDRSADALTEEETEEMSREQKVKDEAFAILAQRDRELEQMRDGTLHSTKWKPPPSDPSVTSKIRNDAFRQYWRSMHQQTKRGRIPETDDFNPYTTFEDGGATEEPWVPEAEPTGFFPPISTAKRPKPPTKAEEGEGDGEDGNNPPIHPSGFIPNSVLLRLLWPLEEREVAPDVPYRLPQMTAAQLAEIERQRKLSSQSSSTVSYCHGDISPLQLSSREKSLEREPSELSFELDLSPKASLVEKFNIDINRSPSPKEIEPDIPSPEPEPPPPVAKETPKPPPLPKVVKAVKKLKAVEKKPPPRKKTPSPPPPPPSPPRPPTPLPGFITQFMGTPWFDEYFPNAGPKTFPKPWTVKVFLQMLLQLIKMAEYSKKTPICAAILTLHRGDPLNEAPQVVKTILSLLQQGPSCQIRDQKEFILAALQLICGLGIFSSDVVTELMSLYLDGDKDVRESVGECFLHQMGLRDTHGYFFKEMDGWDIWSIGEKNRKSELTGMCSKWLDKWMGKFKAHLKKTIEQLKKGNLQGSIQRPPQKTLSTTNGSNKSILKKAEQEGAPSSSSEAVAAGAGGSSKDVHIMLPSETQQLTVTFDVPPDASSIEKAAPIEAINYFVEMEAERCLEKIRLAKAREEAVKEQEEGRKNTVVVLPKLMGTSNLVRLGETHTSQCKPHRETSYIPRELKLPPIVQHAGQLPAFDGLYKFGNKIDFPLKTFYVNPFPGPVDLYEELHQPILLTLRSSQKYFIPQESVVNPENFR